MSIKHYQHVWKNYPGKKGSHKLVFLALAEYANDETDTCWPGIQAIADMVGLSDRQVQRILRDLENDGFIEIVIQPGRRNSNLYRITMSNGDPHVTISTPKEHRNGDIQRINGDADVTIPMPNNAEMVTSGAEMVTCSAPNGDIAVSPEPEGTVIEPEEKSTPPLIDGMALLMDRATKRFEHHRRNGGMTMGGWQIELNKQLAPAQRMSLVETLAQSCGLTAAMEDDTIFHDLHEYAVKFNKAGYTTPALIRELKAKWSTDNWRRENHPMPSLISFFKFASQMAEIGLTAQSPPTTGSINVDLASI